MLRSMQDLENLTLGAIDGDIGTVKDFYFDDEVWVVRYLIVDTGSWLFSRKVLIPPLAIRENDIGSHRLLVTLNKDQVENSPNIDTDRPISRQHEMQSLSYYGYPYYWGSAGNASPSGGPDSLTRENLATAHRLLHQNDDPHLRSCQAIIGYHIRATDGEIGHVESLLINEETWAVQYLVVYTSNWWLGHTVLISPEWIDSVSWEDQTVALDLDQNAVKTSPQYDSSEQLNRGHEATLYNHYGRVGYWQVETVTQISVRE